MNKRVISAIAAIPVAFLFILWGGFPFFMLTLGILIAGLFEFYNMCSAKKIPAIKWWGATAAMFLLINSYFITSGKYIMWGKDPTVFIVTASIMGTMIIIILQRELKEALLKAGITLLGVFYVVWLGGHMIFLRDIEPFGFRYTLIAFTVTWAADIGAYYSGFSFGRKTLHIASPNKSRAGAAGAVIAGALTMIAAVYILALNEYINLSHSIVMGALVGIFAVFGDLSESVIKRNCSFKDSGVFLPGHGGVLDRIDSLLFTVPLVYYYIVWIIL
ncbi:MAG: phosphatidate cytidylyltransferase [Elusimicrobiota bacterium]|nr:phosphatidate cytidylyltransferase [Elusimicrobiota bacterium]